MANNSVSKSWFAVLNNPADRGYPDDPVACCEQLRDEWILDSEGNVRPGRTGAWSFCISADGLRHVHMILEDEKAMRFTIVKKEYACGMHFEETKGSKAEAEAYIKKLGKFAEKGEQILHTVQYGDIRGKQGARGDLSEIEELIEDGKTPTEIMAQKFAWRKYEKMIKDAFFHKRSRDTPPKRDVRVIWHVGESGCGKSWTYVKLCEELGEDKVYLLNDYKDGGFDGYCAEPVLFMDEFKGQLPFHLLLNYLDGYKIQVHARYGNVKALWSEVHITSVFPPDEVYKKMVELSDRQVDSVAQLKRRISEIVFHWKKGNEYCEFTLPMDEYVSYGALRAAALADCEFEELPDDEYVPFL